MCETNTAVVPFFSTYSIFSPPLSMFCNKKSFKNRYLAAAKNTKRQVVTFSSPEEHFVVPNSAPELIWDESALKKEPTDLALCKNLSSVNFNQLQLLLSSPAAKEALSQYSSSCHSVQCIISSPPCTFSDNTSTVSKEISSTAVEIGCQAMQSIGHQIVSIDSLSYLDVALLIGFAGHLQNEQQENLQYEKKLENAAKIYRQKIIHPVLVEVIKYFYENRPHQCQTCGLRFQTSTAKTVHLQFHFEANVRAQQKQSLMGSKSGAGAKGRTSAAISFQQSRHTWMSLENWVQHAAINTAINSVSFYSFSCSSSQAESSIKLNLPMYKNSLQTWWKSLSSSSSTSSGSSLSCFPPHGLNVFNKLPWVSNIIGFELLKGEETSASNRQNMIDSSASKLDMNANENYSLSLNFCDKSNYMKNEMGKNAEEAKVAEIKSLENMGEEEILKANLWKWSLRCEEVDTKQVCVILDKESNKNNRVYDAEETQKMSESKDISVKVDKKSNFCVENEQEIRKFSTVLLENKGNEADKANLNNWVSLIDKKIEINENLIQRCLQLAHATSTYLERNMHEIRKGGEYNEEIPENNIWKGKAELTPNNVLCSSFSKTCENISSTLDSFSYINEDVLKGYPSVLFDAQNLFCSICFDELNFTWSEKLNDWVCEDAVIYIKKHPVTCSTCNNPSLISTPVCTANDYSASLCSKTRNLSSCAQHFTSKIKENQDSEEKNVWNQEEEKEYEKKENGEFYVGKSENDYLKKINVLSLSSSNPAYNVALSALIRNVNGIINKMCKDAGNKLVRVSSSSYYEDTRNENNPALFSTKKNQDISKMSQIPVTEISNIVSIVTKVANSNINACQVKDKLTGAEEEEKEKHRLGGTLLENFVDCPVFYSERFLNEALQFKHPSLDECDKEEGIRRINVQKFSDEEKEKKACGVPIKNVEISTDKKDYQAHKHVPNNKFHTSHLQNNGTQSKSTFSFKCCDNYSASCIDELLNIHTSSLTMNVLPPNLHVVHSACFYNINKADPQKCHLKRLKIQQHIFQALHTKSMLHERICNEFKFKKGEKSENNFNAESQRSKSIAQTGNFLTKAFSQKMHNFFSPTALHHKRKKRKRF